MILWQHLVLGRGSALLVLEREREKGALRPGPCSVGTCASALSEAAVQSPADGVLRQA